MQTQHSYAMRRQIEIDAGEKIGHSMKIEGVTHDDTCVCSCGWKSNTYWDGGHWAQQEWVEHIKKHGAIIVYPK